METYYITGLYAIFFKSRSYLTGVTAAPAVTPVKYVQDIEKEASVLMILKKN